MTQEEIDVLVTNIAEYIFDVRGEQVSIGWVSNIYSPNCGKKMVYVGIIGRDKAEQIHNLMGGEIYIIREGFQVAFPLGSLFR